jgi:hypothetical protein
MAAADVLADGTAAASSADVVIATVPAIFCLRAPQPQAEVIVELKDNIGGYNAIASMTGVGDKAVVINAAATYRFSRRDKGTGGSCGVFQG